MTGEEYEIVVPLFMIAGGPVKFVNHCSELHVIA